MPWTNLDFGRGKALAKEGTGVSRYTRIYEIIDRRLELERGTIHKHGSLQVALVYPSPYRIGMSSLGYQVMYRILNDRPDTVCERAFLPDDVQAWRASGAPLVTYESKRPVGGFDVVAFSLAYELELPGLLECLELSGVPLLASERGPRDPLVVVGGPLTFSNPVPAAPFADLIVMGEAEAAIHGAMDGVAGGESKARLLTRLSTEPNGYYVPSVHGDQMIPVAKAPDAVLPAASVILTPDTELSNMHLVEAERGCHRACTFCVMRRSTNGGMRLAGVERVLETIPEYAPKVGLVGAAVSDHPQLIPLVRAIVERGLQVSLSSLRADRMTPELVELLAQGGYRTLTVASDGASERLRRMMMKNIRAKHLRRTAELVRAHGLRQLKMYMVIGVPNETDDDIDELIEFCLELSQICSVSMGIAPFVAKRNTPLDRQPFAGIKVVDRKLKRLRKGRNAHRHRTDLRQLQTKLDQ
ncbi:MAG: radical SAM protein, partial [Myxococcota bacterium]